MRYEFYLTRELYIDEGKFAEAEKVLKKLRGSDNVDDLLDELEDEKNFSNLPKRTIKQVGLIESRF